MPLPRAALPVLASMLIVASAHATSVKTGKPPASQPTARAFATRDQLRDCLDTEAALKERLRALEAARAAHDKMADQVQAEDVKLVDVQAQLDHDSDVAVQAFNLLVTNHNLHVKQLNQDAADSQPAARAYNADMLDYNRKCSALLYRVDDMDAVMRERKKAAAASAASAP